MNVKLTSELEALIQDKIRSGRYLDASDVIRDALRTWERKEYESIELETALVEGLEGAPEPYGPETLERIRQVAREQSASAS